MTIEIKMDYEWSGRGVGLGKHFLIGTFVLHDNEYRERYDFATPKFIRIKIRRK